MGKVIKHKIQGMSWVMKTSLVLLLTLTSMVFMYEGWYKPKQAAASIATLNQWPATPQIVSNAATGTVTGTVTVGSGTNRMMLVAVACEYGTSAPASQTLTVTYGGRTVTQIARNITQRQTIWMGYLNEAGLTAATNSTLSVTNGTTTNLTAMYASAAVYTGVGQATAPIGNTAANAAASSLTVPSTAVSGSALNTGLFVYAVNWNGQTSTAPSGYTERQDYAGSNFNFAFADKSITTAGNESPTSTAATSTRGAIVGVALNPDTNSGDLAVDTSFDPVNANAAQGSSNNAVDGFALNMSSGSSTVNTVTFTGSAQFTTANIASIKVYSDMGTAGVYEPGTDTLVPTTTSWSGNVATITFTTPQTITYPDSSLYLVVVDLQPAATIGATLSGQVTAATGTNIGTPIYNDNSFGTLTVTTGSGLTINNGTNPANANASRGSSNNALDGFTMATSAGTAAINTLTLTGNANFTSTNVSGIKIYADSGTVGTLDGADTLIPTTYSLAGNVATITFTTPESVTTTIKNYLVVVDVPATSTLSQTLTGTITAATGSGFATASYNDTNSATLTITALQTLTVGNGVTPANANVNIGSTGTLDAFTMAMNTGTASVNTLTLTGNANFTTANIQGVAVYADNGTIGTYEAGTDTLIPTTYSQLGTVGTITFTSPESVTTTAKNYLLRVTLTAGAAVSQTVTGTITAATGTGIGTPVYSDSSSATITISSGPIATIGTCGGCHFYTGVSGNLPQDGTARNTPIGQFPGSHGQHANTYAYACSVCHIVPATTTTADNDHANGILSMATPINGNTGATYGKGASWAISNTPSAFQTCNTTSCHGQRSPVWGSTASTFTCTKCHGQANTAYANTSSALIAPGGAGRDTGSNTTGSRVGLHQNHLNAPTAMSNGMHCGECHTTVTSVSQVTHMRYTSARPAWGPIASGALSGQSTNPSVARVGGTIQCSNVWCHAPTIAGVRPLGTTANTLGIATSPVLSFTDTAWLDGTTVAGTCTNKCHGLPPGGGLTGDANHAGLNASGWYSTAQSLSVCSACHPSIAAAPTSMATIFADKSLHINGTVEAGGDCTGCHNSAQPTTGTARRVSVVQQFTATNNSHHYQGTAALTGSVCYSCHWEGDASGKPGAHHREQTPGFKNRVQLVVWGTSTTRPTTYNSSTYVLYSSGGTNNSTRVEIANITTHCTGCHNDTNKTTAPFPNDTGTPSKYSWEAKPTTAGGFGAAQSIAAKYTQTTTTAWGKYAGNFTNARSGVTKALAGGHGNAAANMRGWSTIPENSQSATAVANYPNTSGAVRVECFDCHNSHGSKTSAATASAVTTSYSSATGRGKGGILKDTTANMGGYTNTYRSYSGGSSVQHNVYRAGAGLCFDCHNNANAGAATSTGNTTPWGYQGTFGSSQGIWGYNDSPFFGKAAGVFAKAISFPYLASITANKGGHFGASSALTAATTRTVNGVCTNCHDPHGVSPALGTNQQYAVPMLKNTFVTSPYKQDFANSASSYGGGDKVAQLTGGAMPGYHIDMNTLQAATTGSTTGMTALRWDFNVAASSLQTLNDTKFAGLCMGCHVKANINSTAAASSGNWKTMTRIHNSVNGWASTGGGNAGNKVHAYTCSKCHTPHNSYLPRLLVTNCLEVKHKGRVASGGTFNTSAPLTGSTSSGNGLGRFPGGGGAAATGSRATAPGPWWFGTSGAAATRTCHDSPTAGGATTTTGVEQLWNTKSTW